MSSVHDRYGRIQQSLECIIFSRIYGINMGRGDLTYFEHYPPCCPSTFGYVYSASVCRMGDDGEDFTLKTDWGAMVVFGFEGFAAGFGEGMTGER